MRAGRQDPWERGSVLVSQVRCGAVQKGQVTCHKLAMGVWAVCSTNQIICLPVLHVENIRALEA